MENQLDDEDSGKLTFSIDMTVDNFLDQYVIWRLKDILRYESDPRVRRACHELLAYMSVPTNPDD